MALFRVGPCVIQVVLTDCPGEVPDLEEVMEAARGYVEGPAGGCESLARLLGPVVEELTGCRCLVEPFPGVLGPEMRRVMALRLG